MIVNRIAASGCKRGPASIEDDNTGPRGTGSRDAGLDTVRAMNDHPAVSIVVPFHDSARTIGACLTSLQNQELAAQEEGGAYYEIIMIDNRSTDASADIVRRHEAMSSTNVSLLEEPKPGAYAARNTGIRAARAPVIALTDADCTVDRDWLRSILDGMDDPETAILIGHVSYPRTASFALRALGAYENAKTRYVVDHCHPCHRFAYANNMAVRSSVFAEIGLFEEWARAADSELVHRLAARRPDLELVYRPSMRVTHHEFERARDRARRMRLYNRTNAKIESFRELSWRQRIGALRHLVLAARSPSGS